jgi:hypothetical protein
LRMPNVETRPGEIVVDSQKAAAMVDSNRRMWRALEDVRVLYDAVEDINNAVEQVARALAQEPAYDAIPQYVRVDESFADSLPPCVACGQDVPWHDALLMPCSAVEDGEMDRVGIVHAGGCQSSERPADTPARGAGDADPHGKVRHG